MLKYGSVKLAACLWLLIIPWSARTNASDGPVVLVNSSTGLPAVVQPQNGAAPSNAAGDSKETQASPPAAEAGHASLPASPPANTSTTTPSETTGAANSPAPGSGTLAAIDTAASESAISRYAGRIVSSIQFRGVTGDASAKLRALVTQAVGEPLDKTKVRASLTALYATGQFADLQVEASSATGNQVDILFITKENYFIGSISLDGAPGPPSGGELIHSTKLELGQLFTQQNLDRGLVGMKKVLEDNGFYQSAVTTDYDWKGADQQLNLHFHLKSGPQARVGKITVTGTPGFDDRQIAGIAKMKPGKHVTVVRTRSALQRLRKKYKKQQRVTAQVSITDRIYQPATNTVDYAFHIERGPIVDVKLDGYHLSKSLIQEFVPIYEENAIDDDLLNEGANNIRDYLQTQGRFEATVTYAHNSDPSGERETVLYKIDSGELSKLTDVDIEGNKYFDHDVINERMQLQAADILNRHGLFSESLVRRDAAAIEGLYIANGFQKVKVTPQITDDYKGMTGRMRVLMRVDEGPQTRVGSLSIVGAKAISEDRIRNVITAAEGQPYSNFNIAGDRDAVLSYYFNRGFPGAGIEVAAEPSPSDPNRMAVTYTITEGRQIFVNRVMVSGLEHTQPQVVNREIQLHPGDPLSESDLLDSQRRLYDLGIFNEVDVAVQNPQGDAQQKNVLLQVKEAKRYTFSYGIGLEVQTGSVNGVSQRQCMLTPGCHLSPQGSTGVSPRVSLDITRLNFRGRNQTIVFKSRLGRLQQRALLSYEQPRWLNHDNLTLTITGFFDKSRDVLTFTSKRLEGSIQARQTLSKAATVLYRFSYRRVKSDLELVDPALQLLSAPVRVGLPSLTYIRDTRDNPTDSRKGTYNTMDVGTAAGIFGSESNFSRLLVQNSTYYTFGKKKWVLARSFRFGFEEPFGKSTGIPLPERFFSGGGNSHRGFSVNQAGPRDPGTGFPLGGDSLLINNIEFRSPPIPLPLLGENLSAAIFHDAGNVFTSSGDALSNLFRFAQKSPENCRSQLATVKCDLNYVQNAVGAGLRYKTPIGPVRIDLGYNLNPPTFPIRLEHRYETLRHFNLFFSIGQTF